MAAEERGACLLGVSLGVWIRNGPNAEVRRAERHATIPMRTAARDLIARVSRGVQDCISNIMKRTIRNNLLGDAGSLRQGAGARSLGAESGPAPIRWATARDRRNAAANPWNYYVLSIL